MTFAYPARSTGASSDVTTDLPAVLTTRQPSAGDSRAGDRWRILPGNPSELRQRSQRRRPPKSPLPVIATALGVTLVGCSGTAPPADPRAGVPSSAVTSAPPAAPPASPTIRYPLTGRAAPSAQAATRPIVAVAVQSAVGRAASSGLDKADQVYAYFPAPRRQRLLAVFQSQDASRVGPVAGTRPLDGSTALVLRAVIEHSGGAPRFVRQLTATSLPQWSAVVHPASFARDSTGALYGSTASGRAAPGARPALEGLVAFRTPVAAASTPAPVNVAVPGQPRLQLRYDASRRIWSGTLGPLAIRATNVILQRANYQPLALSNTPGDTELQPKALGEGKATVLSGAQASSATWNRRSRKRLTSYVASNGVPIRLVPGATWVIIVPTGASITR